MTLRVSGKNLDIGEALRQQVLEKVEATVARYREGSGYLCFDQAADKIERCLRRHNWVVERPWDVEGPAPDFNPVVMAELDLSGSDRVNVVHRRRDGAIGWLVPQASRDPPGAA